MAEGAAFLRGRHESCFASIGSPRNEPSPGCAGAAVDPGAAWGFCGRYFAADLIMSRNLFDYFERILVFAKTEKDRLPQVAVTCPFGETHLAYEGGLNPLAEAHL